MELSNWNWLYNATDKLTKGWLKHGARLLQQVTASAKSSNAGSGGADDMQRFPSNASTSSWQSVCGDAFGHTMMDQHLTKLMQKTSGLGVLLPNLVNCVCYFCNICAASLPRNCTHVRVTARKDGCSRLLGWNDPASIALVTCAL